MIAVIAEKPSVARDIANILGATEKKDGYITGNGYAVTWAYGHLVSLCMPADYGIEGFKKENLPIIPEDFKLIIRQIREGKEYKTDPSAKKQLGIIKDVFNLCDKIIVATDAGREGELIFRYIYNYIGCKKPFNRLWISSLTDKAIRIGFENLKAGTSYDNLFYAAQARSEADWLVGINASQALTIAAGNGVYSLGRVQTPTLKIICQRYTENKKFIPQKYWQLELHCGKDSSSFKATSLDKFHNPESALLAVKRVKESGSILVKKVDIINTHVEAPLLYDLTSLQKDANIKLSFTADKTLSIAQKLYEAKLISYPRTGSRYISEDVLDEIHSRIENLEKYPRFSEIAKNMKGISLNNHSVNSDKVTDHHALIITESFPTNMETDEQAIYELIAGRMLESFSGICIKDITTILLFSGEITFMVKGTIISESGWTIVFDNAPETPEDEQCCLPVLNEHDMLCIEKIESMEKQTHPKPIHTEASLLSAMEMEGKELENNELKEAMKGAGIGTPATRASIIETLLSRDYIKREKKNLVPTDKGIAVFEIIKDKKISDVILTGEWENALAKIESGEMDVKTFMKAIDIFTHQITNELISADIKVNVISLDFICPKCGKPIVEFSKGFRCSRANCDFIFWSEIAKKKIGIEVFKQLLKYGHTDVIRGFIKKAGGKYNAALKFGPDYKIEFDFTK